jgi:hypothetical protein
MCRPQRRDWQTSDIRPCRSNPLNGFNGGAERGGRLSVHVKTKTLQERQNKRHEVNAQGG